MTPTGQRIGIIAIAAVMIIGTIGSYAMIVIANDNAMSEQQEQAEAQQKIVEEQQKEMAELSEKYYPIVKKYEDKPAPFDADKVGDKVTHVDLKQGDGEKITENSSYRAYYIGWNPEGVVFDQSIDGDSLKPPLDISPGYLVDGWYEGVEGMKKGGIREITIPSDLAYGEQGMGGDIPPNTPIKFIVFVVDNS